jgi:DNA primase large subunit
MQHRPLDFKRVREWVLAVNYRPCEDEDIADYNTDHLALKDNCRAETRKKGHCHWWISPIADSGM